MPLPPPAQTLRLRPTAPLRISRVAGAPKVPPLSVAHRAHSRMNGVKRAALLNVAQAGTVHRLTMSATEETWIARKGVGVRKASRLNVGVDVKKTALLPGSRKRGHRHAAPTRGRAVTSTVMKKGVGVSLA